VPLIAAPRYGERVDAFQVLTGLAGDAFPSQTRALSGSAYPAFSLRGPDSQGPVRVARDVVPKVRVFDPRHRSKTVGLSTEWLPVVRPADRLDWHHERRAPQSDEAPGSIELDASSPEKCQQVREAHGSMKSRQDHDIARRREALVCSRSTLISMGRRPQAPACGGLGAGREPDPPSRVLSTSDPSPEARLWTRPPRRRGRGVRFRGHPRP